MFTLPITKIDTLKKPKNINNNTESSQIESYINSLINLMRHWNPELFS